MLVVARTRWLYQCARRHFRRIPTNHSSSAALHVQYSWATCMSPGTGAKHDWPVAPECAGVQIVTKMLSPNGVTHLYGISLQCIMIDPSLPTRMPVTLQALGILTLQTTVHVVAFRSTVDATGQSCVAVLPGDANPMLLHDEELVFSKKASQHSG